MKPLKKKFFKRALLISVIHLIVTIFVSILHGEMVMSAFDSGKDLPLIADVCEYSFVILAQPALSIWTSWMSKHMPDTVEWVVFLLNSALWGLALSLIWRQVTHTKPKTF